MGERNSYRISRRALDYLLAIYMASRRGSAARLTEISEILGVSAPSAHEYLAELIDHELVVKAGRGLYRLTPSGEKILMRRIWAHGVLEEMLVRIFKIDVDAACSIASQIDLEIRVDEIEKICSTLGHPKRCPHGYTIPHIENIAEGRTDPRYGRPCIKIASKLGS